MAIDTGHGATITFGTQGGTWRCTRIAGHTEDRPDIDATYLATTSYKEYVPGDLLEPGEFVIDFQFQGTQGCPARSAVAETVTITHPLAYGGATAATVAGTAYVKSVKFPDMSTNELQMAQATVKWDGYTGPTYTAAT